MWHQHVDSTGHVRAHRHEGGSEEHRHGREWRLGAQSGKRYWIDIGIVFLAGALFGQWLEKWVW